VEIAQFVWSDDRIAHIARHHVLPEEFEEVCFGDALVLRARTTSKNPVYYVLGQTEAGRQLLCVVISFADGKGYPVTARDVTDAEKRRYVGWKRP